MKDIKNIKKEIVYKAEILVREYDHTRCAHECQFIEKQRGTYQCTLFNKDVDHGDDEINGDYIFTRCSECLKSTKET